MNQLVIQNNKGNDVTTSLIVAEVFGKNHADVLRDIRNLHCSDEFHQRNFAEMFFTKNLPNNGHRNDPYIEMSKDGFSFLVMGYTGEKAGEFKETFIAEFNKREVMLKSDDYILARSQEILNNRLRSLEANLRLSKEQLALQEEVIKVQAPKVEYYEKVLQSESWFPITLIAKDLGMSAQALNDSLKRKGVLYKVGRTWVLTYKHQGKGYTHSKTVHYYDKDNKEQTTIQTNWTEKGRQFIFGLFNKDEKAA